MKYGPEPGFNAILKLFDRRFGTTLRRTKSLSHTVTKEEIFQESVRTGAVDSVLRAIEEETRASGFGVSYSSEVDGSDEVYVLYEANLWQTCEEYFDHESKAYKKLSDLQGKIIPQLFAHVQLPPLQEAAVSVPADLLERQETAQYFQVKGLLMQLVDGYELWDLPTSGLAPANPGQWQGIVQAAVDAAHTINRKGICMNDCSPYNVVVEKASQRPFIVDLAQYWSREDIDDDDDDDDNAGEPSLGMDGKADQVAEQQQSSDAESDAGSVESDWDPEIDYWEKVEANNNCFALGGVMAKRLLTTRGITITPEYPDYQGIIASIKNVQQNLA